jgi:hypothetical protein
MFAFVTSDSALLTFHLIISREWTELTETGYELRNDCARGISY